MPVQVGGTVRVGVARGDDTVVRLAGPLSLSTVAHVGRELGKLLAEGPDVLVDVAALEPGWTPAVEVFPLTLEAAGGWPVARMVLFGAAGDLADRLRTGRVATRVPLVDDLSAARARVRRPPEVVHRHRNLPCAPTAGRAARREVRAACRDWLLPHLAPTVELIASELVVNAVEHAASSPHLTITLRGPELTVGVRDHHPCPPPRPRLHGVGNPRGLGLLAVTALATRWGTTPHPDGKTVWATVATAPEE